MAKKRSAKPMESRDKVYLETLVTPIRVCANYRPKFGKGQGAGLTIKEFQVLYQADVFYKWLGLDHPLMYAAHKAAGGMTSIYRQIGIGCESLFRKIIQDELGLTTTDVKWSYEVASASGKLRRLSLDARIPLASIRAHAARQRVQNWMASTTKDLGVAKGVAEALTGIVFEVRQGYKSKDSKRQNADIGNAATAYAKGYLPCALVLSSQIDTDIIVRYKGQRWQILTGTVGSNDPMTSTYDFVRAIVGYDLASFLERNSKVLKHEVALVLKKLLTPTA
jgi:hypothetical protein